ncbi:MAG: pilus assembly protein PilM [Syntrophobacterales bacterium]
MPEKILGIDIAGSGIKVVQVTSGFRTSQVSGYAKAKLPADADPSQVASSLADLIAEENLESDRYRVALGTHEAFLRRLRFPFSNQRKISQVIQFEMEPDLPLALDKVQVDFVTTESRQAGSQGVLAAALPRVVLDPLLAALREVNIEPEVVDLDGSGLTFIARELKAHLPERAVILDIGHDRTNLLYQHRGVDTYLRSLSTGCGHFSKKIAEVLGMSVDEAMERLFAIGIDQEATSPEHLSIREAMTEEVESLAREIEFSLTAARVQERDLRPELVILSGGGSLIEGLAGALAKALGVDVRCLNDLKELALVGQFGDQFTAAPLYSVAAGLAFKGTGRRAGFNFQAEEVGSQNPLVRWRQQLSYALVACALVAFAWLGSVGVDMYTKKRRLASLNQSVEEVFRRTVPEFKGSVQSSQYTSIVKTKISELGQSVALFGEEGYHSAVELLRVISKAIPADLNVTISLLTVDNQRIRLNGQADAFNTVDGVKNRLTALDIFDKVTITGAKAAKDGKGVQFGLELNRHQLTGEG